MSVPENEPVPIRIFPGEEATRSPIFLFQSKVRRLIGLPDWLEYDGECFWIEDRSDAPEWMVEQQDSEDGLDQQQVERFLETYDLNGAGTCYFEHWETERVFFTRVEARRWGEARAYRWPDGWRVYCVCAEGELEQVLAARTVPEAARVDA